MRRADRRSSGTRQVLRNVRAARADAPSDPWRARSAAWGARSRASGSGPILVDRRYTWALGEAVQWSNASGDVSTATAFRSGRMCDLATHQCAPW